MIKKKATGVIWYKTQQTSIYWRSRVQSQPLRCRVRPWTSCSHTLSSASGVTTLWCYINQFKFEKNSACEWQKFLSAAD